MTDLDPQHRNGIAANKLFELLQAGENLAPEGSEVTNVEVYWEFVMRYLRLMALGVGSSVTDHASLGRVYSRVVGGKLGHRGYTSLLGRLDNGYETGQPPFKYISCPPFKTP